MNTLLKKLSSDIAIASLLEKKGRFVVHETLPFCFALGAAFIKKPSKILVLTANLYQAQNIYEQLSNLIGEDNCLFFPKDEVLKMNMESASKEILLERLEVLKACLENENKILITHNVAFIEYLSSPELFKKSFLNLKVGQEYSIKKVVLSLEEGSFKRVNKIDNTLQYSLRGDILDIYPFNAAYPIRIEFFDDEIESIRFFHIEDQLSFESIKEITICPSKENIINNEMFIEGKKKISEELTKELNKISATYQQDLEKKVNFDLEKIEQNGIDESTYAYFSYFEDSYSILDYFKPDSVIIYNKDKCLSQHEFFTNESFSYYSELNQHGLSLSKISLGHDLNSLLFNYGKNYVIHTDDLDQNDITLRIRSIPFSGGSLTKSVELIQEYISENKKIIVALNQQQKEAYMDYLLDLKIPFDDIKQGEIPNSSIGIVNMKIDEGFELVDQDIVYLSAKEIYGSQQKLTRFLSKYKEAKIIKSYEELEPGDYVVHEECGIGQFSGIVTLKVKDVHQDFLKICYAGKDILYVPLEKFTLVRKFVSKEGAVPKINKLGSTEWEKTKQKIKNRVNLIADRLMNLYAERQAIPGFAFKEDDEFQYEFEKAFPYSLTSDQIKAVEEIKKDMEKPYPMDRLLCGDVGFGKTEVAFRAAFKAILSGKQVALLCPTTILARQHYDRAVERFATFGIKIALFSRFVKDGVQKRYIQDIKEEKIHLIIGTHRLLNKEIVIPELGLLIVDEEQRFGVEHKERIKEMATNIDVLTLTATPIPRTLQMSLLGIRNLSQLLIAPSNRMPIQTYVTTYQELLIQEVIERELARDGQVFYLHNVVSTIYSKARKIQNMVKNANVGVVHGKMDKTEIEDTMEKFYRNEINVLVCTSIIETGLDIANANTIIIEDADRFGLSQLYQIKGRVGRSNKIAYAYLLYRKEKQINEIAVKRLKAIKDFTELGSGYKIAQRDLTIRGAGDILGPEQAGFIDTVGIDMYLKLLNEVLDERKGKKEEQQRPNKISNLQLESFIPSKYASDADKLQLYQEILTLNSLFDLEQFKNKLLDIYGKLPQEVQNLLIKRRIDILANNARVENFYEEGNVVYILLTKEFSSINRIGIILFEKLSIYVRSFTLNYVNRQIKIKVTKQNNYLEIVEAILKTVVDI